MYDTLIDVKFSVLKSSVELVKDSNPMLKIFYNKINALDNFIMNDIPFDSSILKSKNNRTNLESLRIEFFKLCCKNKINNPYMFNQYNKTPQYIDHKINPEFDLELHPVLENLWNCGITTIMSCAGHTLNENSSMLEVETETASKLLDFISPLSLSIIKEPEMKYWPHSDKIIWPTERTILIVGPNDGTKKNEFIKKLLTFRLI
ncbi:MAG: hypothetical protein LBV58_02250 [Acholeplasmatales bacterium]|jgi:hypothetical protein|nr:hypothetical protein [Acholeplasmatales bacterium]